MRWCCNEDRDQEEPSVQRNFETTTVSKPNNLLGLEQGVSGVQLSASQDEGSNLSAHTISEKEIEEGPGLSIIIKESSAAAVDSVLEINPGGLKDSFRSKYDGRTFIGSHSEADNDYIIEEEQFGMGARHFVIIYRPELKKYFVKDLGQGTGTFVRIDNPLVLKDSYIVSFADSHMATQFFAPEDEKIVLKFLEGPKQNEVYTFTREEKFVLIGRMVDCRIRFDDSNLSRYQCMVAYNEEKGWVLFDGDGDKKSTNGTWLFVDEEFEIFDGMVFKAGKTLFEAKVISC